jgi:hypothetical protein
MSGADTFALCMGGIALCTFAMGYCLFKIFEA